MSPIRKLIDRFTGQQDSGAEAPLLRGFGKLPAGREFLHIDCWQDQPKAFQEWIRAGHEAWVTRTSAGRRGSVTPCSVWMCPPDFKETAVAACIWPSRDAASPPRVFPFSLFVLQKIESDSWVLRIARSHDLWTQLQDTFTRTRAPEFRVENLRGQSLTAALDPLAAQAQVQRQMQDIPFGDWLTSVASASQWDDPARYLALLESLACRWRERATDPGFAVRLPLSRSFDYLAQSAGWLCWLASRVGKHLTLSALFIGHPVPESTPAMCCICRAPTPGDFQLLTTNAHEYDGVEDGPCRAPSADSEGGAPDGPEVRIDELQSLAAWASGQV